MRTKTATTRTVVTQYYNNRHISTNQRSENKYPDKCIHNGNDLERVMPFFLLHPTPSLFYSRYTPPPPSAKLASNHLREHRKYNNQRLSRDERHQGGEETRYPTLHAVLFMTVVFLPGDGPSRTTKRSMYFVRMSATTYEYRGLVLYCRSSITWSSVESGVSHIQKLWTPFALLRTDY